MGISFIWPKYPQGPASGWVQMDPQCGCVNELETLLEPAPGWEETGQLPGRSAAAKGGDSAYNVEALVLMGAVSSHTCRGPTQGPGHCLLSTGLTAPDT